MKAINHCPLCGPSCDLKHVAATTPARAHEESRAISMLTDDQAMASFIRWRTEFPDTTELPSLKAELGVAEYVDAIFARCPE